MRVRRSVTGIVGLRVWKKVGRKCARRLHPGLGEDIWGNFFDLHECLKGRSFALLCYIVKRRRQPFAKVAGRASFLWNNGDLAVDPRW